MEATTLPFYRLWTIVLLMATNVLFTVSSSMSQDTINERRQEHNDNNHDNKECHQLNQRCHSNRHCCLGYKCSPLTLQQHDPNTVGSEQWGVCVLDTEFNRSTCDDDDQCGHGGHCVGTHTAGTGFCEFMRNTDDNEDQTRSTQWSHHMYRDRKGALGSACETTGDCNKLTMDGQNELCCQDVRRGRQGTKRMCDRLTPISICIN